MSGISRSVSPLEWANRSASERSDADVNVDELNALRTIGNRVRKFVFTDKIRKAASEFLLRCVGKYEEQMMGMIAKNEKLCERIDKCEKLLVQKEVMGMSVSYASMAGKDVDRGVVGSKAEKVSVNERVKKKTYAVVMKAKDETVKMTRLRKK